MLLPGELHVRVGDEEHRFAPGTVVTIGRSGDNLVVVDEPTVSRRHAEVRHGPDGWRFEDLGGDRSFVSGRPVTSLLVTEATDVRLAATTGPLIRLEPPAVRERPAGRLPGGGVRRQPRGGATPTPGRDGDGDGDGDGEAFDLREALHILVPLRSWWSNPGWRQGLRLLVIPYALLPLIFIALFRGSSNLTTPGWAYSLYVAPLWLIAFYYLIRPGRLERLHGLLAVGLVVWVALWIKYVTIPINDRLDPNHFVQALGVGYNEELTKALPILVAALALRRLRNLRLDPRLWMLLGTVAGLTFGVLESSDDYTSQALASIALAHRLVAVGGHLQQVYVLPIIVQGTLSFADRIFVDGFQHAVWAGIAAFFMGMAANYRRRRVELALIGLSVPALLHAFNDWISPHSLWVQVLVDAASLALFLGYTMSARTIERQVRATPMFRGASVLVDLPAEPSDAR